MTVNKGGAIPSTYQSHISIVDTIEKKEEVLSNKKVVCSYLMTRNRHLGILKAKISRIVHKRSKPTFYSRKEKLSYAIVLNL